MAATGTISSPPVSASAAKSVPVGMSAPSPLPSPPRRATAHLFRQFPVGLRASRCGVEHDDRLAERRRLGEPDGTGHDRLVDPGAEVLTHLGLDLIGETGPGVVHGQDDPPYV